MHLGNLQKVLLSAKEEPHRGRFPWRASQELAAKRQPRVMSRGGDLSPSPLQWPPHPCLRGPERKQDPAQSKEAEGGWGCGGGVKGGVCRKEERCTVIPTAQPARPAAAASAQLHTPTSRTGVPKGPSAQVPPGSGPTLAEGLVLALQPAPATGHFRLLPSQEVETSGQPRPRGWVCFASWRLGLLPGFFTDALDVFSP